MFGRDGPTDFLRGTPHGEVRRGQIDLSWYLYEFVALHIPIRHVHPEGECDEETYQALRKHLSVMRGEGEEENESGDAGNEAEKETDPRWDALKKIKDNN